MRFPTLAAAAAEAAWGEIAPNPLMPRGARLGYTPAVPHVEPRPASDDAGPPQGAAAALEPAAQEKDAGDLVARLADIERELGRLRVELVELASSLGAPRREPAQG